MVWYSFAVTDLSYKTWMRQTKSYGAAYPSCAAASKYEPTHQRWENLLVTSIKSIHFVWHHILNVNVDIFIILCSYTFMIINYHSVIYYHS